jgi:hypothetical protein
MGALGCQLAVSLMLVTPYTDKGEKSTRIGYGKQRRDGIEGVSGAFSDKERGNQGIRYEIGFRTGLDHCALR